MKHLFFVEQEYSFAILRPLAKAAIKRGDEVRWFLMDVARPNSLTDADILETTGEVSSYAPESVIAPGNWVPRGFSGLKTHLFHGFAIDKPGHFRIRGHFDLYCTHGSLTTGRMQELADKHGSFRVIETGFPKLDRWSGKIEPNRKISKPYKILYAPTFSKSLDSATALVEQWRALASNPDFRITAKFHAMENPDTIAAYEAIGGNLRVKKSRNILKRIYASDIMVTDTSSVMAESIYFGRPVLTFRNRQPGAHIRDFTNADDLGSELRAMIENYGDELKRGREYAEGIHPYTDGNSADRVLDAIHDTIENGWTARKRKPYNLSRQFNIYKKMRPYRRARR